MKTASTFEIEQIERVLEKLYLGSEATYEVHFSQGNLAKIQRIFDFIILRYGIKTVNFEFVIDSQRSSVLIPQKESMNALRNAA